VAAQRTDEDTRRKRGQDTKRADELNAQGAYSVKAVLPNLKSQFVTSSWLIRFGLIETLEKRNNAKNIKQKDALHIACAIKAECEYFLTTDRKILNKNIPEIKLLNPLDFIRQFYIEGDEK
jgi:predicted nucleic acid-binding protein